MQASAVVIAQLIAPASAGFNAQAVGYAWHFTIGAVLCAVAVLAVMWLYPRSGFGATAGTANPTSNAPTNTSTGNPPAASETTAGPGQ